MVKLTGHYTPAWDPQMYVQTWGSSGSGAASKAWILSRTVLTNTKDVSLHDLPVQHLPEGHGGSPLVLEDVQADSPGHTGDIWVPYLCDEPHLTK